MEKNLFKCLLTVVLILNSLSLMAESKSYKIELLVFAQDKPSSEVFDQYDSQIQWPTRLVDISKFPQAPLSLTGIRAKLQRTVGYHPLLHTAWIQAIGSNRISTAVHFTNNSGTVNGFFRIQRGHYLHLITDLEYTPDGSLIYRLNEKRRFKLKEIHYLDHPRFGVIVRVYPL